MYSSPDPIRFDNVSYLEKRVAATPRPDQGALRTTLLYLYKSSGPVNLSRERFRVALPHLDAAEAILVRWLHPRTNGHLRARYGAAALKAARLARYACEHCHHNDVRVLNLDHVMGRSSRDQFACLCANCHCIKSRARDWTGKARENEARKSGA